MSFFVCSGSNCSTYNLKPFPKKKIENILDQQKTEGNRVHLFYDHKNNMQQFKVLASIALHLGRNPNCSAHRDTSKRNRV